MARARFESLEALEAQIGAYFDTCEGEGRPPTLHGLALGLGFNTPEEMARYRGRAAYREAILRAVTRQRQYAEEQLLKSGAGARFALDRPFSPAGEGEDDAAEVMAEVRRRLRRKGDS